MVALIISGQVAASSWSTASSEDSDDSSFSLVLPAAPITTDAFTGCTWSVRCSVSLIDVSSRHTASCYFSSAVILFTAASNADFNAAHVWRSSAMCCTAAPSSSSGGGCDNRERSCEALRHDLSPMASIRFTIEYPNTYASLASNYLRLRRITLLPT